MDTDQGRTDATRPEKPPRRLLPLLARIVFGGFLIGLFYLLPFARNGWRGIAVSVVAGNSVAAIAAIAGERYGPLAGWRAALLTAVAGAVAGIVLWLFARPHFPFWVAALGGAAFLLTAAVCEGALTTKRFSS